MPNSPFTRRRFLSTASQHIGAAALASLLKPALFADDASPQTATAKRVIFLTQSGAPSQMDLFDYKPALAKHHGQELSAKVRMGQRLTSMTADQDKKPITQSLFKFAQHGKCGAWVSELLPHTAEIADDLTFVRSLHTDAINHDPGLTFLQTGAQQPGRPGMGSWVDYGLGSENENLPGYVVFVSGGKPGDQPLFQRLWDNAFLPAKHAGAKFRGQGILYLNNPDGVSDATRNRMLETLGKANAIQADIYRDPAIRARIENYERTAKLQTAVPELYDLSKEDERTLEMYGPDVAAPGSFARNCLLARRLAERGVRFVQLFHRGWDHHTNLPSRIKEKCQQTDQPSAALIQDLKQRGLLKDTLVIWAGEFGRTAFCQGDLTEKNYGRDHHPRCFTVWMAGGGMKPGLTFGKTDDFSYNVVENPVSIHDLHATMLHTLGVDHEQLTYRHAGRDFRLTDVAGKLVREVL